MTWKDSLIESPPGNGWYLICMLFSGYEWVVLTGRFQDGAWQKCRPRYWMALPDPPVAAAVEHSLSIIESGEIRLTVWERGER